MMIVSLLSSHSTTTDDLLQLWLLLLIQDSCSQSTLFLGLILVYVLNPTVWIQLLEKTEWLKILFF